MKYQIRLRDPVCASDLLSLMVKVDPAEPECCSLTQCSCARIAKLRLQILDPKTTRFRALANARTCLILFASLQLQYFTDVRFVPVLLVSLGKGSLGLLHVRGDKSTSPSVDWIC